MATVGGSGRATATVLFTDLVGSTELRSRLGDTATEELRRRHDRLLAEAVEANHGRVVKSLGDGIMATFDGASDAVAAAAGMQQSIDRQNRSENAPVRLGLRVGLSAGDVTFEEADCFGTPVIEAARLCAVAVGGQVLASEIVRWLAGSAATQAFSPVGALELKGLPDPVPVCEVVWEPPQASVPLPALLTDVGRIFVGREHELLRLGQLWEEVEAGDKRVAFLDGEPGVGKTRLAAALAGQAHDRGAMVLVGRCDEDMGVPYQPFVEAVRHFVDHVPSLDAVERFGRYGGELVRLVPELAEAVPQLPPPLRSDPETERYRLFDAVAAWLGTVALEAPLLLVLDDLQWAAKPTLLLLRHVVRSPESKRLLVLGTYRDTELGDDHPLVQVLADLGRQGSVERLSLSGLDQPGVAAFLEHTAGHPLHEEDQALARAIYEETEGNPFFVREVLRHLAETGALSRSDGSWATQSSVEQYGIPEGVREVVGRRLARLSEGANRVLRVAAVTGTEFEFSVVREAADLETEALLLALEEAIRAGLLTEVAGSRHRFAHALVRDTIYGGLPAARRLTLHERVAAAIEDVHVTRLDDHLPALAHHYARASALPSAIEKAIEYAARAGEWALSLFAHDQSVGYYRNALELLDTAGARGDDGRRQELMMALGEAERRAGDGAYRETLLDAARLAERRGDAHALARAALANQRGTLMSTFLSVDADRVAILEAALTALGRADSPVVARLLARLSLELVYGGDSQAREAFSDEALEMARRLGDRRTTAEVLMTRGAIVTPHMLQEQLLETAELLELAHELEDPLLMSQALHLRIRSAMEAGEIQEADRCLDDLVGAASDLRQPTLEWIATYTRAGRLLFAGHIDEAERLAERARDLCEETGQPDTDAFFHLQLFGVRFEQGRLAEVEKVWARESLTQVTRHPLGRALLVLLSCELGRRAQAKARFDDVALSGFADLPMDNYWLLTMACYASVAFELGDKPRADVLLDDLTPFASHVAGVRLFWFGSVAHYLGLLNATLGRFDEAEERFAAAETTHARVGASAWLARTRLEWARMLLARPQPADAGRPQELLRQVLATARDLGLGNMERRAVELLQ